MNPPRVRLHPDGRAVVEIDVSAADRWVAVGVDSGSLNVELFRDDDAADWPEYTAPVPPAGSP